MNKAVIKKKIQKDYSNFAFESITKIGEGADSVAYLVNDSLIFRFPKNAEVRQNLAKEIIALPILQQQLRIDIPNFEYIGSKNSFFGYKNIEGVFLTKELLSSFSQDEQESIQKSLAEFLATIHKQDLDEFKNAKIEVQDFRAEYQSDFDDTQKHAFPLISEADKTFITEQFQQYLENEENFSYRPVLLHNDLSADHILVDAETKELTGVIDFGDIGIGDADYDLMYLLDDYGEGFVHSFLQFYSRQNDEKLFLKLYFWGLVDILQLINHYSEENEIGEIEELSKELSSWISLMKNRGIL